jgi:adenylate cyclase
MRGTMRVVGLFPPASNTAIASDARAEVVHRLGSDTDGWTAVAVGSSGHPGVALKAGSEQDAVTVALGDCDRRDRDCHVIAIGPFLVGAN